jgi:hypothetical protein
MASATLTSSSMHPAISGETYNVPILYWLQAFRPGEWVPYPKLSSLCQDFACFPNFAPLLQTYLYNLMYATLLLSTCDTRFGYGWYSAGVGRLWIGGVPGGR